jgi:hypothetical protein
LFELYSGKFPKYNRPNSLDELLIDIKNEASLISEKIKHGSPEQRRISSYISLAELNKFISDIEKGEYSLDEILESVYNNFEKDINND